MSSLSGETRFVPGHRPTLSSSFSTSSISSHGSSTELLNEAQKSPKWPKRPMPLTRGTVGFAFRTSVDLFLLAATAPFIALGVFAAIKNGEPVDEKEWAIFQTGMNLCVSTFPIAFAAIVGRLTKNAATWKLERGITLGHLEQLLGSSSVFGTFSTQILMGSFNMLAVGLFVLWALSPLGGQSSLHILKTVPSLAVNATDLLTFNTEIPSPFSALRLRPSSVEAQINGLYITSLMAPPNVKRSPVDIWGNFKVPLMSSLALSKSENETGWFEIGAFNEDVSYSSLIGIPVGGLPWNGNTTLTVESSYFDVDCYSLSLSPYVPLTENFPAPPNIEKNVEVPKLMQVPNNTFYGKEYSQSSFTIGIDRYIDWKPGSLATLWDEGMSSSIQNVTGNEKRFFNETQTFLFESKLSPVFPGVENPATVAYCNVHRIYVETAVNCVEDATSIRKPQCFVTAVRESQTKHQPSDIVPFLFPSILSQFSTSLAHSQGQQQGGGYSLTEKYLNNTDAPLLVQDFGMRLFNLDKEVFSQRLTQVINTYYMASLFPSAMVGGLDTQLPIYTVSQYTSAPIKRATSGTVTSLQNDLYSTNIAWLTVFLATSTVMMAAAATSSVLAYFTAIPDVLGYASSLTRDSAYFPHSSTKGSVLDGLTRSRKLKDQKVKLGDVRCNERIGLLAFSEADAAVRAEKKKLYQ